jgi:Tfp pilus assembly protein PilX
MMKNVSFIKQSNQSGAVSLFVVVFFMLLITVVTVSFLRLMVADQQQASNNDLSQSAYDSAQAGVEDAKRALLKYKADCLASPGACATYANALTTDECNAALTGISGNGAIGSNGQTKEILVQQSRSGTDTALNQAYTCVTIALETQEYLGTATANESQLVPLMSSGGFDRVKVDWFSREDITSNTVSLSGVSGSGQPLYSQSQWPVNRPSLLRAQLIQFAGTFTEAGFDTVSGATSNAATMFLYPTSQQNIPERAMTDYDQRKTSPTDNPNPKDELTTPTAISCKPSLGSGGYACSSTLVLPQAIGASSINDRTAFLRLTPFYNSTHFRVTLWNGPISTASSPVLFKDVQPVIDSTGRANDLFRRVQSSVNLYDTTFPYPEAAIDLTGNFCKDFSVTDTAYIAGSTVCTP